MERAYSLIAVKAFDGADDVVRIRGIASTPTPDRVGDIVEPGGASFNLPIKLLWQHDHTAAVGNVTSAKVTEKGIEFEAELPRISEEGTVKTRVDEALHSLKYGLVNAVSIGFRALKDGAERMKEGGIRFKSWEWLELSIVSVPAQPDAVITAIKAFDQKHLPASGDDGVEGDPPASVEAEPKRREVVFLNQPKPARKHQIIEVIK